MSLTNITGVGGGGSSKPTYEELLRPEVVGFAYNGSGTTTLYKIKFGYNFNYYGAYDTSLTNPMGVVMYHRTQGITPQFFSDSAYYPSEATNYYFGSQNYIMNWVGVMFKGLVLSEGKYTLTWPYGVSIYHYDTSSNYIYLQPQTIEFAYKIFNITLSPPFKNANTTPIAEATEIQTLAHYSLTPTIAGYRQSVSVRNVDTLGEYENDKTILYAPMNITFKINQTITDPVFIVELKLNFSDTISNLYPSYSYSYAPRHTNITTDIPIGLWKIND